MWAVSYLPPPPPHHPLLPKLTKPSPMTPPGLLVSAKSQPQNQDLGGLGHSILTKLKSNPKPTANPARSIKQGKQKQGEGKQVISGSDVLFAMQKAASKKNRETGKNKKKGKVSESSSSSSSSSYVGGHREEEAVDDYGNVRPLYVKSEWGRRLDDLEKRLKEISSKAI